MKIAFGMIVFWGGFVLKQVLESVYEYADQILIAEGPVRYWQDKGYTTSPDDTNDILDSFPDPDNKIIVVHGQFKEKDEQCNAYMQFLKDDCDYLWQIDSDEVYKKEDIERTIEFLKREQPTSVGIKPISFIGGFDRYIGGFEQQTDNFIRIFKASPNCKWVTHRPPTLTLPAGTQRKHITSDQMHALIGLNMFHVSYIFYQQVINKIGYYECKVAKNKVLEGYIEKFWIPWLMGSDKDKEMLENIFGGCHEFKYPQYRSEAFSKPFDIQQLPLPLLRDLKELEDRFIKELKENS